MAGKNTKQIKENINPDGVIKRGYLREPVRFFELDSVETKTIPPHYHEFHKVILFISGKLDYMVEGRLYHMHPGELLIIPAFAVHQPIISPELSYKRYVQWISRDAAKYLGMEDWFLKPRKAGFENTKVKEDSTDPDPTIREVIKHINKNIERNLSIDSLSETFYISKAQLIKRFKAVTGYTPHQYIIDKRLGKCTEYIDLGMSVSEAAEKSGFSDYSSFYRAFKKAYGVTPRSFI